MMSRSQFVSSECAFVINITYLVTIFTLKADFVSTRHLQIGMQQKNKINIECKPTGDGTGNAY